MFAEEDKGDDALHVWVDADACPKPVLQCVKALQTKFNYGLTTVASFNHFFDAENHIVVGPESQATDMVIANRCKKGDVVITQDWGLAALAIARGSAAISPVGSIYQPEKMVFMLEQRNALAKHRRGGGRTKGPSARTSADDERFCANFEKLVQQVMLG